MAPICGIPVSKIISVLGCLWEKPADDSGSLRLVICVIVSPFPEHRRPEE